MNAATEAGVQDDGVVDTSYAFTASDVASTDRDCTGSKATTAPVDTSYAFTASDIAAVEGTIKSATPPADTSYALKGAVGSAEFWSAGLPEVRPKPSGRVPAKTFLAKHRACDLSGWTLASLQRLAADRGVGLPADVRSRAKSEDDVRRGLMKVIKESGVMAKTGGPSSGLAGWLGAHRNFRAYADGLVEQAATLMQARSESCRFLL
jgi:hypothetical protein